VEKRRPYYRNLFSLVWNVGALGRQILMKVLVTGHKGFIGTIMVPLLQSHGHTVRGIDSDLYRYSTYGPPPEPIEEIIKDVRDIEPGDLEGVDAVVSLAALSNDVLGDFNPDITNEINHRASVRLAGNG